MKSQISVRDNRLMHESVLFLPVLLGGLQEVKALPQVEFGRRLRVEDRRRSTQLPMRDYGRLFKDRLRALADPRN